MSDTTAQLQYVEANGPMKVAQVPKPAVTAGNVLIRLKTTALNPLDAKQRNFNFMIFRWPHVFGVEGAGVVEAVGDNVTTLQPGDEVMAMVHMGTENGGSYQERILVNASQVAKKPTNISFEEAASVPIAYITAAVGLQRELDIQLPHLERISKPSPIVRSVLVLGGSSSVGAAAVQLLRLSLPSALILVTSSTQHHERLVNLGATKCFDYRSAKSLLSDIKAASPDGRGVDLVFDSVGAGASQDDLVQVFDTQGLKKYAAVLTGVPSPVMDGITNVEVNGTLLSDMEGGEKVLPSLTELMENGKYKVSLPVKVVGNSLKDIPEAMDLTLKVSGEKLVSRI